MGPGIARDTPSACAAFLRRGVPRPSSAMSSRRRASCSPAATGSQGESSAPRASSHGSRAVAGCRASEPGAPLSITDQVDRLDVGLFEHVQRGGTSFEDLTSLLAVHAAIAARGSFDYLEV